VRAGACFTSDERPDTLPPRTGSHAMRVHTLTPTRRMSDGMTAQMELESPLIWEAQVEDGAERRDKCAQANVASDIPLAALGVQLNKINFWHFYIGRH
jgi:hypothetical protein